MKRAGTILVVLAAILPVGVASAQPAPGPPVPLVRIPFPQDDGSLTPYTFELGYDLMTLVYDTLLVRDADGLPQPWLATSVDTSPDGRRVTAHLAGGARWHDGAPLTAADVAFTFRHVATHPHPRFTPQVEAVAGVEAPDPGTVVFQLRHPSPGFIDQPLADVPILPEHLWAALPPQAVAPAGLPIGSGPYRLVEHREGEGYRFDADADYFRARPAVEHIEVVVIRDAEATFRAFQRGDVDMVPVNLPDETADRFRGTGARIVRTASYLGHAVVFNTRRPPFDRPEARRAVSEALDLGRIQRLVGGGVTAEHGILHPESPWASADVLHTFDEANARVELARLGLGAVRILVADNDPLKAEAARQVGLALTRAGIGAEPERASQDALSTALGEDGSPPTFTLAVGVIPPLASDDPDFLRQVFPGVTGYTSAPFADATVRASSTPDPTARRVAVSEQLRILATDLPVIPLYFPDGTYAYRPGTFAGWKTVKGSGILGKRSFVEPAAPEPALRAAPGTPAASEGSGLSPIGIAALTALGLGLALAAFAVLRR